MEPCPRPTFEVVQAEFFLELLMGLLADPAGLDRTGQSFDRDVVRQVREIVFAFAIRATLAHQPGFLPRHVLGSGRADPLGRSVGNAHSHRGEARSQVSLCALAPTDLTPLRVF